MRRAVLATVIAAGMAGIVSAQTGNQPADDLDAIQTGFSNINSMLGGANRQIADNFTLTEATVIEEIEWAGIVYNGGIPADLSAFQILIFSDSNGAPGVFGVPAAQVYPPAEAPLETSMAAISAVSLGDGPVISMTQQTHYLYSTPTSISLPAGDYWIQISGVMANTGRAFAWARHFGGNGDGGHALKQTSESEWNTGSGDFAWVLSLVQTGDTDGDGLLNSTEADLQVIHPCLSPLVADSDGDGLSDGFELLTLGTNPCVVDTDGDGLADAIDPDPYLSLIVDEVLSLDPAVFDAPNANAAAGKRGALANQFGAVLLHIEHGNYPAALSKLQGLTETIDKWLIDCEERDQLQQHVVDLATVIAVLI